MPDVDSEKQALLHRFGKALNTNDVVAGSTATTDDFVWIYYEGPNHPEGRIIRGFKAACEAVVERANRLKTPIVFSESNEFPSGDKILPLIGSAGNLSTPAPSTSGPSISTRFAETGYVPKTPTGRSSLVDYLCLLLDSISGPANRIGSPSQCQFRYC